MVEQIAVLVAVTSGAFDEIEPARIAALEHRLRGRIASLDTVARHIAEGRALDDGDRRAVIDLVEDLR